MKKFYISAFIVLTASSCGEAFLEIKPEKSLTVPTTLEDFRALLDNEIVFSRNSVSYHGQLGSDDFFLSDNDWRTLNEEMHRNRYLLMENFYGDTPTDVTWNMCYQAIFYANVVIEGATKLAESIERDNIIGSALFLRAWHHNWVLNLYAKQYNRRTSGSDIGIPLRLESDINLPSKRVSVEETYRLIEEDLLSATDLLDNHSMIATRPSKKASLALLARIKLQKSEFTAARSYAEQALSLGNELIDYSSLDRELSYPFERFNKETIFYSYFYAQPFNVSRLQIEPTLLDSYAAEDIRRDLFFVRNGEHTTFRGSYDGSDNLFCGLANDELYLIVAECLIRESMVEEGLSVLGTLLNTRFENGYHVSHAIDRKNALEVVIGERRKQLLFRGVRWFDLKRLNLEEEFAVTVVRNVEGREYRLEPNSLSYVLELPPDVRRFNNF